MTDSNLELANVALGQAVSIQNKHDSLLKQYMDYRADYEHLMGSPVDGFDAVKVSDILTSIRTQYETLAEWVVGATKVQDFAEFRRTITQAQNELSALAGYQDRIDSQSFFQSVYVRSGHGPQNLPDGQDYNAGAERLKLQNIKDQYLCAVARFVETVGKVDVGEVSMIVKV